MLINFNIIVFTEENLSCYCSEVELSQLCIYFADRTFKSSWHLPSSCPRLSPVKDDAGLFMAAALSSSDRRPGPGTSNSTSPKSSPLPACTLWWDTDSSIPESGVPRPNIYNTLIDGTNESWHFLFSWDTLSAKSKNTKILFCQLCVAYKPYINSFGKQCINKYIIQGVKVKGF